MKLVLMFPGQSSIYPTMIEDLVAVDKGVTRILQIASEILGRDLIGHYSSANPGIFNTNQDIQVGMFLANYIYQQLLEQAGILADLSLGLSLGEYNHLVHIGVLSFEQALLIVNQRGELYEDGPRGCMAAIFPLTLPELQKAVAEINQMGLGVVEIANHNSPRQHVLSGTKEAVTKALEAINDEFYVEGVIIEDKLPMHSSLFESVGQEFSQYLAKVEFEEPHLPYLPNRLANFLIRPTAADVRELLASHVYKPVLWKMSIDWIIEHYADAIFVETGPRRVLSNLLDRKWLPFNKVFTLSANGNLKTHLDETFDQLYTLVSTTS